MSKKFWVDFTGYGYVEAENEDEAERKFWQFVHTCANDNGIIMDDVWDLDNIEEYNKMAEFQIIFIDSVHGTQIIHFDTFEDAAEFWDQYADTPTCIAGELRDLTTDEIVWGFGEV